ncbi:MAG TPA: SPOR domain-containing protein [Methylibium sp.]|uniref:SPOR domain-containing protein n=1 Tax=Methylibium sp. TaxID=2067992 RepID=UPI002DBFE57B|nr:SPOR domain-containing protein [Methylibium sp.]HEU4458696.1 SPOR domain-containing protein [Methylibium sp.]
MLRAIVVLLLLANLGFYAWREGWLAPLHGAIGARPEGDREPERLARQVRPEAVRLIPAEAASSPARVAAAAPASEPASAAPAPAAPATATACLEAGPFGPADLAAAEATLNAALPNGGWGRRELGPSWWVAMGPFEDAELMQKKRAELRRRGIVPDTSPFRAGGAPVLVISRHDSVAAAESALAAWGERGVRSARIVQVALPQSALRVPQADAQTQGMLAALPVEKLRGRGFAACGDGA